MPGIEDCFRGDLWQVVDADHVRHDDQGPGKSSAPVDPR